MIGVQVRDLNASNSNTVAPLSDVYGVEQGEDGAGGCVVRGFRE